MSKGVLIVTGIAKPVRRIDEPLLDCPVPFQTDVFGNVKVVRSPISESNFRLGWRSLVTLGFNRQGFVYPILCSLQGVARSSPFIIEGINQPLHFGRTAPTQSQFESFVERTFRCSVFSFLHSSSFLIPLHRIHSSYVLRCLFSSIVADW